MRDVLRETIALLLTVVGGMIVATYALGGRYIAALIAFAIALCVVAVIRMLGVPRRAGA